MEKQSSTKENNVDMLSEINEKISIIVPVYNVESQVERCLDSIIAQLYTNFEVICVDDGSTDHSGEICDRYQEMDKRFRVFHFENQGVSHARNYALAGISGAWFCFVDADDCIEPNYLSELHDLVVQNGCDIAACSFYKEYVCSLENVKEKREYEVLTLNSSKECIHNFICSDHSMHGMVWNKLYDAEKFKHLEFRTDISINEDCLYTYEVMKLCEKACITMQPLYHWLMREDSACHAKPKTVDFRAANVFWELYQLTESEQDLEIARTLQKNYICSAIRVLNNAVYKKDDPGIKEAKERCKKWRKNVWSSIDVKTKLKFIWALYGRVLFIK